MLLQEFALPAGVPRVLGRPGDVEVVAPRGQLEAVVAPALRLLGERRQRQVGPLAGEEGDRARHRHHPWFMVASIMTQRVERLVNYLFDGAPGGRLASALSGWLERSSPFRAFADAHKEKIRKKLRGAADDDASLDVRAELLAARLLLDD